MRDAPDATILRRRRILIVLVALGLLFFGTRTSWVQDIRDLAHGLRDGFVDGADN